MKKITDLNVSPYYDSTQKELDKGYIKYLAVEGEVLQNRELNVAQGLIYGNIKKVTDLVIDDGSIISGCNFVNNETSKICTLYPGEIYVNGVIVKIPETSWAYKTTDDDEEDTISSANTIIYAEIVTAIYDENDDKSLYDPAENMENYGNAGGHRLKYEAKVGAIKEALYSEKASASNYIRVKLYKLVNRHILSGVNSDTSQQTAAQQIISQQVSQPIFGKVYKQLAQNTYDISGDFIAEGMGVSVEQNPDNPLYMYNIRIAQGRAYVRGYGYSYNNVILINNAATDTDSNGVIGENKTYYAATTKYYLNHSPVASVSSVSGTLKQERLNLVYTNGINTIPSTYTVNEVLSIIDSSNSNGYDSSYYTVQGNTITWKYPSDSSKHPTSSFYVTFLYTGSLTSGVDFNISSDSTGYYITFANSTGKTPAEGQTFNVKYSWYLSRIDLVYDREDGLLTVKNGIPGVSSEIKKPTIPAGALPLAVIYVDPIKNPIEYSVETYDIYRVPVAQLQNMKKRLTNLEYDVAMTKLETDAQNKYIENDSLVNLKNIFVDGMVDMSKADTDNAAYSAYVNIIDSEVTLPLDINDGLYLSDLQYITYDSSGNAVNDYGNGVVSLDIVNKPIILQQLLATSNKDIAPYYYKGLQPIISASPSHIMTIEEKGKTHTIWLPTKTVYKAETVEKWLTAKNTTETKSSSVTTRRKSNDNAGTILSNTSTSSSSTTSNVVTSTSKTTNTVSYDEIVDKTNTLNLLLQPYIKEGEILTISGSDWPANTEIRLYMDNSIISPEFENIIYTSDSPFVMPASSNITFENNSGGAKRSHIWNWQSIYLTDAGMFWKLSHPLYTKVNGESDGISYYYDSTNYIWYYHRDNTIAVTSKAQLTALDDGPSWAKYLSRSPWINHYLVTEITSSDNRTVIEGVNNTEPLTETSYANAYALSKTTIVTDSAGNFEAEIKILPNTLVGSHTIIAETVLPENYDPDYYYTAKTEFSGDSYIQKSDDFIYKQKVKEITDTTYIYKQTVNTTTTTVTHHVVISSDPLAQSFIFDDEQYLSGLDLYFYSLPYSTTATDAERGKYWFFVSILDMENGYPSTTSLYNKIITGADKDSNGNYIVKLATDLDSTGNLSASHIDFDYPIYIQGDKYYAFSVGSNRDGFHILYAQMGQKNLIDKVPVTLQPISNGVMFTSSDSNTWSVMQDSDLTYRLYGVDFSTTSKDYYIYNVQYTGSGSVSNFFSIMNISMEKSIFENTEIGMYYGINVGTPSEYTNWLPLKLSEKYEFSPTTEYLTQGMKLSLKFTLKTNNAKLTPMINLNTLSIYLAKYKTSGSYLMTSVTLSD